MINHLHAGRSSAMTLAIALATGSVMIAAVLPGHAQAQRAKKERGEKKEATSDYSPAFVAAYTPVMERTKTEPVDWAAASAAVPTVVAAIQTPGDRHAAGQIIYLIGTKSQNQALQLQGAELMLESGKVPAESVAQYNQMAGQLAYQAKDYAKSRTYLNRAIEAGMTTNELEGLVAESYFNEENYAEGLRYLASVIDQRKTAGQPVNEKWVRRGLAVAYNNQLPAQVGEYGLLFVDNYPTPQNWGEVIALNAYGQKWDNPELLDLLRLARELGAMRDQRMYVDYVDAADYRRFPGEVVAIIDEGYASGKLQRSDSFVSEARAGAASRASSDKAELGKLVGSAQKASDLKSVMVGGDLALSYGDYAAAEALYTRALGMPGVDAGLARTRLGIAQLEQGKAAEAKASFDAVTGKRQPIARLWSVYASQKSGG